MVSLHTHGEAKKHITVTHKGVRADAHARCGGLVATSLCTCCLSVLDPRIFTTISSAVPRWGGGVIFFENC